MTEQGTEVRRRLLAGHLVAGVTVSVAGDGYPDDSGLGRRRVCHRIEAVEDPQETNPAWHLAGEPALV